jgi:glycosyltransferase involved in cell wall biosynthesis
MGSMAGLGDPQFFWIGPFGSEEATMSNPAISPAATRWQEHLVSNLKHYSPQLKVIGYTPARLWPRGPLSISSVCELDSYSSLVGYWNVPFIKQASLVFSHLRELLKEVSKEKIFVLITYNSPGWIRALVRILRKSRKVIWITVCADGPAPPNADAYVFLSWGHFTSYETDKPKIHLDGAIYNNSSNSGFIKKNPSQTVFLYSGTLSEWGGAARLVEAFKKVSREGIELWVMGQGDATSLQSTTASHHNIKIFGLLTSQQLQEKYAQADVFVNPRPVKKDGAGQNFPSKLFDYLAWDKPIISTWSAGLSPAYRELLIITESDSALHLTQEMLRLIDDGGNWSPESFCAAKKSLPTWAEQAVRLHKFVRDCIKVANSERS